MEDFEEHFLKQFKAEPIELKYKKNKKRVILRTPNIDYCFSYEGWQRFKEIVNQV